MALPPTIPTSFVPHAISPAPRQFRSDLSGAFNIFAYGVLVVALALALGVFLYARVLASDKSAKDAALASAQAAIDKSTVENFIRLRNRLTSSGSLLDKHAAPSGFFTAIETILPTSVRFTSLHLTLGDLGTKIESAGVAKNFNALAVASNAFAADGRVKDAIFSNISINKDSSVSFALSATLDPKLIAFVPGAAGADTRSTPAADLEQGSSTPATLP